MEKIKGHKKIIFPDIDDSYAERDDYMGANEWIVYTNDHKYIGFIYLGSKTPGIIYPSDMDDKPEDWINRPLREIGGTLKNAVRFVYLNWKKLSNQYSVDKIRKIVREMYMGNDWAEPEWWTKNKWGKDSPGPDPFSPDALGSAVGSAMNTTAEGEEVIPEYWKNGGDEPLSLEPFSDEALGNYFMPENKDKLRATKIPSNRK